MRLLSLLCLVACLCFPPVAGHQAEARGRAKKRFYFEVTAVTNKAQLSAELEAMILPKLSAEVQKQLAAHPQFVAELPGAPSAKTDDAAYRKFLARKGIAGAYSVSVQLTSASEELEQLEGRGQRLVVRLSVHLFGETIPGKTMGFTGDGSASIRQEIGKKLRPRDQEFTWQSAIERAVSDAISTFVENVSRPAKK